MPMRKLLIVNNKNNNNNALTFSVKPKEIGISQHFLSAWYGCNRKDTMGQQPAGQVFSKEVEKVLKMAHISFYSEQGVKTHHTPFICLSSLIHSSNDHVRRVSVKTMIELK